MNGKAGLPAAISAGAGEWLALLARWSEINSGSGHVAGLQRMSEALEECFRRFPATFERLQPGPGALGPTLSVRCRPDAPVQVLLSGHYDTVFAADHPFQRCVTMADGSLNGPGVADMKGGLVVMAAALTAFETLPSARNVGWEVLLTSDEEEGSRGSRAHLLAAAQRHDVALVFEPSPEGDDVVRARKGTAVLTLKARGRAAHSSRAKTDGCNAVVALAEFVLAAHGLNREIDDVVVNVANFSGGGPVNVVPDLAQAELHLRCSRKTEGERAMDRLRTLAGEIGVRTGAHLAVEGGFNRPPMEPQTGVEPWLKRLQACAAELGQTVSPRDVASASDANFFAAAGLPTIDGLGVDGDGLHSDREFMRPASLSRRVSLVARWLAELAEHPEMCPRKKRIHS